MKNAILTFVVLVANICFVQADDKKELIQLKGQVLVETSEESVPYVTITVQNDSSVVLTRQASDATGHFSIHLKEAGTFQIILSAVGYNTTTYDVAIEHGEKSKNMGKLTMKEGVELKEVSVVVQKPLIKSDPDKLVYSVEADPEAQSNTLAEMLRKVPMLSVDSEGNVTLNGQENYKVLVNGKTSSMMSNNFKEVIKSMPANSIKDIEVITNPSSKYEAEGVGGIINIITAKNTTNGYTGSVGLNRDSRGGYGGNVYFSATVNKFSFSTNFFSNQWRQPEVNSTQNRTDNVKEGDRYVPYSYFDSDGKRKVRGDWNGLNLEASYEIDTFNLISVSASGNFGHYSPKEYTSNTFKNQNLVLEREYNNKADSKYQYGYISGNIDYQRSFAKKDKTLTTSYKLEYNPDNSQNIRNITGIHNYDSIHEKNENTAFGMEHTFQLDFFEPLTEKHQIETGVKGMYRLNFSETDYFSRESEHAIWEKDHVRKNDLDYKQYIVGAYAGYQFKLEKFTTKAGLRGEYTLNDGFFKSVRDTAFTNTFFNLIPYLNLTYTIKPSQTIKASYTQRIFRPRIWALNPYEDYSNPSFRTRGNPELEAELSHTFGLSYGLFSPKFNINIELNSSISENAIQRYSYLENEVLYSTFGNIGTNQRHSANVYTSYRPSSKFSVNINARLNYVMLEAQIREDLLLKNDGFMGWGNVNARLETWKGGSVSLNAGAGSRWIMLQGKGNGYHYSNVSVMQKVLKDKLDLTLSLADPFTKKIYFETDQYKDPTYTMHSRNERLGQTIRFSATYRFGKMNTQVKKARRGIQNDDKSSGEGQSGGQGGGQ